MVTCRDKDWPGCSADAGMSSLRAGGLGRGGRFSFEDRAGHSVDESQKKAKPEDGEGEGPGFGRIFVGIFWSSEHDGWENETN